MHARDRYLQYLDRSEVEELVLQSGRAAFVRIDGQYRPVTKDVLTSAHLAQLWAGTVVAPALARPDSTTEVEVEGPSGRYVVHVSRRGDKIQIRVGKPVSARTGTRLMPALANARRGDAEPVARPIPVRRPTPARTPGLDSSPLTVVPEAPPSAPPVAGSENESAPRQPRRDTGPLAVARIQREPASDSASRAQQVLAYARSHNASDVHLMSNRPASLRQTGDLVPHGDAIDHHELERFIDSLLHDDTRAALASRGYTDFALSLADAGRMRVNLCRQQNGLKACFRLVVDTPPSVAELGLPAEVSKVGKHHQGLVVISGPNGHGKTTTMAALLDLLNRDRPIHIITVEDPVEIVHPIKRAIVNQREVGPHTASFQRALKAALREDPDVIAIGELRDQETVAMALNAAETGHLVLATMSTPSGATTIDRLIDMFPPDEQTQVRATLSATLKMIVSQRLVPRADVTGRVAAIELISGSVALSSLIRDNKLFQLPSLLQRGRAYGMIRLEDSLAALSAAGTITHEVARAFADDPRLLRDPKESSAPSTAAPEKTGKLRGLFGGQPG